MSVILRITALCLCVGVVSCAILCRRDHCDTVNCATAVPAGHQPPCKADQVLDHYGTTCGCCPTCVTQMGEGADYRHLSHVGGSPPMSEMKKRLGLSGTITIASRAVPTAIAASPYKLEQIKLQNNKFNPLQINNLETLKRSKRQYNNAIDVTGLLDFNLALEVPIVAQTEPLSCGPAIAESLLRSLGLRNFRTPDAPLYACEERLIHNMETTTIFTDLGGGTYVTNWVNAVNNYIINNNLNNLRRYVAHSLNLSIDNPTHPGVGIDYNDYIIQNNLLHLIYNSLINDMPVAFGFTGRFNDNEQTRSHFILINGVSRNYALDNHLHFSYMDPDGGVRGTFSDTQLNSLLSSGGVLIYHDPQTMNHNNVVHEPMEIGNSLCDNPTTSVGAGAGTGAVIGATLGTEAVPVIGTAIGAIIGTLVALTIRIAECS